MKYATGVIDDRIIYVIMKSVKIVCMFISTLLFCSLKPILAVNFRKVSESKN